MGNDDEKEESKAEEAATTEDTSNIKSEGVDGKDAETSEAKEHAKIDDPVEPPARNAPKKQQVKEATGADEASGLLQADANSILSRLFDPDRKQKPALWAHIKLVAPGPADQPPPGHLKWRSKDAIAAYCLMCKKQFTYTKGTSKTISRHMMAYHGMISTSGEMADETTPVKKRALITPRSTEPPLKKRKPALGSSKSSSHMLLKWLVGSFRPFSIVEDLGLNEFIKSCSSERMPSTGDMLRLALDQSFKIKQELRSHTRTCQGFSLGCEQFKVNGETFTSVKVGFCTSKFERKSFTLAVKSGASCGSIVKETLAEFDLSEGKITTITLRDVPESEDLGLEGCDKTEYIYDVLHQMETLIMRDLDKGDVGALLNKIREHVTKSYGFVQNGDAFAKCSSEYDRTVSGVYKLLQKFQSPQSVVDAEATKESDNWQPTDNEKYMAKVLSEILKPFFDATTTLSGEKFPTVGLAVPVFRRIHDILEKIELKDMSTEAVDVETEKSMQEFLKSLAESFSSAFSSILGQGHPLMWTIPLDPRLVHMRGLSDEEKESVTKSLVEKLKTQKVEQVGSDENVKTKEDSKKEDSSSTMGGIFWGEEEEEEKGSPESVANYAQATVDRYFNTVRAHRRIDDPLDWWKSNQAQFPELSQMAKLWFGGSATIEGIGSEKKNYTGENFALVAFLHENTDLISSKKAYTITV